MYSTVRERLIHIHHCRGIGWKSIERLLQLDSSLSSIFSLSYDILSSYLPVTAKQSFLFFHDLHSISLQSMIKTYREKNIHIVTIFDKEYPSLLKHIYDPPWVLYVKGNIQLLQEKRLISVVGTRKPTPEGMEAVRKLLPPLINEGWVVVSGLAAGIDAAAHHIALEQKRGKTIGVVAGGLAFVYPKTNKTLFKQMAEEHLLITEQPLFVPPQKWHFPMRNRIISGLSYGTIVIQAKEKSGSLITAQLALDQGREVFAVPGSIFSEHAIGTNRLIQQGAKLVLDAEDIFEELAYIIKEK